MHVRQAIAILVAITGPLTAAAQLPSQPKFKIDPSNRTLTVMAEERVSVDPDLAIVHIGFESKVADAKTAYAEGARTSNAIVAALKQAGLPETAIRSESQRLESIDAKNHKFKLVQTWTVKSPPERAAEVLDIAVNAGATESGEIDWTVQDLRSLEDQALDHAAGRARSDAAVMAKASGAKLGAVLYLTNQVSGSSNLAALANYNNAAEFEVKADRFRAAPPLAIEPRKVSRTATVYAVFAIE